MTSDLSSVVLITLFGLFLFRWLATEQPRALLAAAGSLAVANSFRYENWLFVLVFSLLIVFSAVGRWKQRRLSWQSVTVAVCALTIINAFPIIWTAASYYVLGDWLPPLHTTYVSSSHTIRVYRNLPKISIPVLAFTSFPFEVALSIAGVALFLRSDRRISFRVYLLVLVTTFLLFTGVLKGQLPVGGGGVSRTLLSFIVLPLPYAGFLLARLLRAPELGRNYGLVASCLILLAIGTFDIIRAFNYPASFPKDAIYAGWIIRGLQKTETIPDNGKILIERAEDWGDVGIVALANRPERFVLLNELTYQQSALSSGPANRPAPIALLGNEGVRGDACEKGFQAEACRNSLLEEKFN